MDRNYEDLAQAIILQAVKDWRCAVKKLKKDKWDRDARATKREVEAFFHSYAFKIYTELDGQKLLARLKEEAGYGC